MDPEQFRIQGKQMVDFIADYMTNISKLDVLPSVQPGYLKNLLPDSAPENNINFDDVMKHFNQAIMPGMTHWHHPNFYAFYPTAFSFPSLLGSMLSDGIACIGLNWQASPACTELEVLVLDWLAKSMKMPEFFLSSSENGGGTILSSASEATLMVLLVERNIMIKKIQEENSEITEGNALDRMVVYFTKQAHSSVERACALSLLKFRIIETDSNESMNAEDLSKALLEDKEKNLIPLMVITSFGSTSLCVFDNLYDIGTICKEYGVKFHVDAAYAGSSLICPEYQYLARGIEFVNSFCFNAHKMLKTHFDCSVLWTDNRRSAVEAFSVNPLYLAHDFEGVTTELRHWQVPLGRRFRALKLWFVLNMFGIQNLQQGIRQHVKLAILFADKVNHSDLFEVVNRVDFGLVCFRIKNDNEKTRQLHNQLKLDHSIFLSPSILEKKDVFFIRFVCGCFSTEKDVLETFDKINAAAMKL
uniref:Aromatic-L-amino-acid decarboxylase n=1 Tax=Dugesia japonica TaxID=6161 RepID=A6P4D4_DUGJA|nr:aromatic amino acid decarboxylase [Dugesia japonica]